MLSDAQCASKCYKLCVALQEHSLHVQMIAGMWRQVRDHPQQTPSLSRHQVTAAAGP